MHIEKFTLFSTFLTEYKSIGVLDEVTEYCNHIDYENLTTRRPVDPYIADVFKNDQLPLLRKKIKECAIEYITPHFKFKDVVVDAGWIRVNPYLGETLLHDHSVTPIVAVYYVNSAPKCGDLILIDPRGSSTWPELEENNKKYTTSSSQSEIILNKRYIRISPEPDKLIIFPGNVLHFVETNKAKNFHRITVNINLKIIR